MKTLKRCFFGGYPCSAIIIIVSNAIQHLLFERMLSSNQINTLLCLYSQHHHHHLEGDHHDIPYNARGVSSLAPCIQGCCHQIKFIPYCASAVNIIIIILTLIILRYLTTPEVYQVGLLVSKSNQYLTVPPQSSSSSSS